MCCFKTLVHSPYLKPPTSGPAEFRQERSIDKSFLFKNTFSYPWKFTSAPGSIEFRQEGGTNQLILFLSLLTHAKLTKSIFFFKMFWCRICKDLNQTLILKFTWRKEIQFKTNANVKTEKRTKLNSSWDGWGERGGGGLYYL